MKVEINVKVSVAENGLTKNIETRLIPVKGIASTFASFAGPLLRPSLSLTFPPSFSSIVLQFRASWQPKSLIEARSQCRKIILA